MFPIWYYLLIGTLPAVAATAAAFFSARHQEMFLQRYPRRYPLGALAGGIVVAIAWTVHGYWQSGTMEWTGCILGGSWLLGAYVTGWFLARTFSQPNVQ